LPSYNIDLDAGRGSMQSTNKAHCARRREGAVLCGGHRVAWQSQCEEGSSG
jgi:hypothetical protein